MKTIETLGQDFNKRHSWLLNKARKWNVALCGGCAAAVTKGNKEYIPKDIDFAATKSGAAGFISEINNFMMGKSAHWRIYANSKNEFVPSKATAHFRVTCGFWLPICIFVLPELRSYRIQKGHLLQMYDDIKQAADELTEIDGKPRIASELTTEEIEYLERELEHETQINSKAKRIGSGLPAH